MGLFVYYVRKRQLFLELLGTENLTECPLCGVFLRDKSAELKDMSLNYRMDSEWYNEEDALSPSAREKEHILHYKE